MMKKEFEKYLILRGYKEYTPSGNRSTVYDYSHRVDKVCEWEHMNWEELASVIEKIRPMYEDGGSKSELGKKSNNAVRCALRCFEDFVK